jgi:hypothetical protein
MVSSLPIFCVAAALCTVRCTASWSCVSCVGFVFLILFISITLVTLTDKRSDDVDRIAQLQPAVHGPSGIPLKIELIGIFKRLENLLLTVNNNSLETTGHDIVPALKWIDYFLQHSAVLFQLHFL